MPYDHAMPHDHSMPHHHSMPNHHAMPHDYPMPHNHPMPHNYSMPHDYTLPNHHAMPHHDSSTQSLHDCGNSALVRCEGRDSDPEGGGGNPGEFLDICMGHAAPGRVWHAAPG